MHLLLRQQKPPITCRENLQKNFIFMDLAWGLNSGLQKTFDKLVYQKIQHQNVYLCCCFLAVVACKCRLISSCLLPLGMKQAKNLNALAGYGCSELLDNISLKIGQVSYF